MSRGLTINREQFERVKQIFDRAVRLPPGRRTAFVDSESADDIEVRLEVERLLGQETSDGQITSLEEGLQEAVGQMVQPGSGAEPGMMISHYRLTRRLGAGGMGEVWLARDQALGRPAAIKLLHTMDDHMRVRLVHEAEASARLQHPAIATFHEAGESDGTTFLAMEYVEGATLRDRLKSGGLPASQALAVTACVLEALAHAHSVGILHRDIKPENIMLTGEQTAKLLDFGIATRIEPHLVPGEDLEAPTVSLFTQLTAHGAIAGTIGYMSPEQLRGEPLDGRSDLFAVGAVLHEMLTGRAAFPGKGLQERIAAILSKDPEPVRGPGIPAGLADVLARSLSREAAERYPSAMDFLADLRRVSEGEAVAALPDTLAVFTFDNVSGNAEDDWIGSGMAESLTADLARVAGLAVVGRERVARALAEAGETGDPFETGLKLGCRWVLAGSFQHVGPMLRITTRLCEAVTGHVLATEKIDGKLDDVFQMQDRLAAAVAESLNLGIATPQAAPQLDAYECYARGRSALDRFGKSSMEKARDLFEQAIGLDPGYAPALSALTNLYALRFTFTTDPRVLEQAIDYGQRAIAADRTLAEPHTWMGYALMRQGRPERGLQEERLAMELDPAAFWPPYFAGCCLTLMQRREEALEQLQRAAELGPNTPMVFNLLGELHSGLYNFAEAEATFRKAIELERRIDEFRTAGARTGWADMLRRADRLDDARSECMQALSDIESTDNMYRDSFRGHCLCVLGQTAVQQGDLEAARAAFTQAAAHQRGRPRALGSGHLIVRALAGLAQAGAGAEPFCEAVELFERRAEFDFSNLPFTDDGTLLELARAAAAIGQADRARELLARARAGGYQEALREETR